MKSVKYVLDSDGAAHPSCWESTGRGQEIASTPVLNGYYVWWCREHKQPSAWCAGQAWRARAEDLQFAIERMRARITRELTSSVPRDLTRRGYPKGGVREPGG